MPILTGVKFDRHWESQKTIVTIEFTTLTLCWVQNFIKIEAFAILCSKLPKLWPNRWQVHILTCVNIDRLQKLQKNYCLHWVHHPRFVQRTKFLQNWCICHSSSKAMTSKMTVPTLASVKNHKQLFSSVNSAPSHCLLCKILWKMVNFISCSPFPFLKTAYLKLRYGWEETRISKIRSKSSEIIIKFHKIISFRNISEITVKQKDNGLTITKLPHWYFSWKLPRFW